MLSDANNANGEMKKMFTLMGDKGVNCLTIFVLSLISFVNTEKGKKMNKELVIELEEECIECPMLSLETECLGMFKWHQCKHLNFCKPVRRHWEEVKGLKKENEE